MARPQTTDLEQLVTAFSNAVYDAPKETRAVVSRGGLNIKKDWRKRWSRMPHIRLLVVGIGYDITQTNVAVSATVGVDAGNAQAPIGHIIEYGSPTSAPIPGGLAALAAEEPRFVSELQKLAAGLLER